MEIAITYLIFVIIISIIGSTRGRGLGGFFMSLLLSPLVGLIWVLAMPNLKADKEEKVVIKKAPKKNDRLFLVGVNFEFNSTRLTPESYPVLDHVSKRLKENPELRIEIEGHCDIIGTIEVNQRK